ncbi:MAG: hypothetical protein ACTHOR_05840 [Devosia sp.]|nr:hypothetical protein [Devosiaceae bacterium]
MTENELKFHLEEYKLLRGEIAFTTKLLYDTFFWATLASGLIAAWLLTNSERTGQLPSYAARVAFFIPFCVSILACGGFYHFHSVILNVARYLRRLEAKVAEPSLGWEAAQRADESASIARISKVRFGFGWTALIGADFLFGLLVG